jgi:hypothetical protein
MRQRLFQLLELLRWAVQFHSDQVSNFERFSEQRAKTSLLSTGFTTKVATTPKQRQELQTLPEGKVSPVRQNGETFYIYPDAPHNQIYVGSEAQYRAYENLLAQQPKSTDPFVTKAYIAGHWVPVKEFFGWHPLESFNRRS